MLVLSWQYLQLRVKLSILENHLKIFDLQIWNLIIRTFRVIKKLF
jgi:hypothetical protein